MAEISHLKAEKSSSRAAARKPLNGAQNITAEIIMGESFRSPLGDAAIAYSGTNCIVTKNSNLNPASNRAKIVQVLGS